MAKIYPRQLYYQIKPLIKTPQAIVITGMRRVGKTSLLQYIFQQIESKNKLFLDLENPITRKIFEAENYQLIKTTLEEKGLDFNQRPFIFLDEIQWLPQIPSIVKYFYDHYQVKFFLTGSASFYLKNLFSESLAGRKFIFELYPLSFQEFLEFKEAKIDLNKIKLPFSETTFKLIEPYWQEYLSFGAFPEVVLVPNPQIKRLLLEEIFTSYFQKEIQQLADFRKTNLIRELIILLGENIGSLLNIQRLSKELKVSRQTVEEWLSFLEATYFISLVSPFARKQRVAIRKAKKIYFIDWGLASQIVSLSSGQKLENCAFHLLRLKGRVSFWRKKTGREIDFILDQSFAFEIKKKASKKDIIELNDLTDKLDIKKRAIAYQQYSISHQNLLPVFYLEWVV